MLQNIADFKAKSFLSERNTSTMAYEVKAVRAMWDPSLSIPGTNRRGGWRCPTGTRYGGQITDRFGRSCGWGVARRIANQISDIGQRLENVDDARRGRRIARRERRILARLNPQGGGAGRLERGLRGVADRLEVADSPIPRGARRRTVVARPPSVDAPATRRELTPTPPAPRARQRRRAPNVRESEQRRMNREIEQPGAPRTGEAPARRRRRAVVEATKKPKAPKQQAENVVDKPVVEPKVVKPRRPKKNPDRNNIGDLLDAESAERRLPRPAPRGQSDNAARSEEVRAQAKERVINLNQVLNDETFVERMNRDVMNQRLVIINDPNLLGENEYGKRQAIRIAELQITRLEAQLDRIQQAQNRGDLSPRDMVQGINDREINVSDLKKEIKEVSDAWKDVIKQNQGSTPKSKTPKVEKPNPPKVDNESPSDLAFKPAEINVAKLSPENEKIVEDAFLAIRDPKNLQEFGRHVDEMIFMDNQGRMEAVRAYQDALQRIVEKYKANPQINLQQEIEAAKLEYVKLNGDANRLRLSEGLNRDKREVGRAWGLIKNPGVGGEAEQVKRAKEIAKKAEEIGRREQILQNYDLFDQEINKAVKRIERGLNFNPNATGVVKPLDADVAKKIKSQIDDAIKRRSGKLAEHMKDRYGSAKKPFEDMTKDKWNAMSSTDRQKYLEQAFGHSVIKGANGKLYNAVATVRVENSGNADVYVEFNEIDANGRILRSVGTSGRTVNVISGYVKNDTMFVRSKLDRGADIQTIYNQHSFLYLKNIGVTNARIGLAVQDGQYVWARVGFNNGNLPSARLASFQKALSFYENFGGGGLINSSAEYFRIKSMVDQTRAGRGFSHQEWIFAIDDPANDKIRREFVKHWFIRNAPLPAGEFSFAKNKVGGTAPRAGRARQAPRGNA